MKDHSLLERLETSCQSENAKWRKVLLTRDKVALYGWQGTMQGKETHAEKSAPALFQAVIGSRILTASEYPLFKIKFLALRVVKIYLKMCGQCAKLHEEERKIK